MSYFTFENPLKFEKRTYNKPVFLKLISGQNVQLRILQNEPVSKIAHWFGGSIECLGEDCPVCETNKKLRFENPEDYRQNKSYRPQQVRVMINVLDRSLVKVCPKCGEETHKTNENFSAVCVGCNTIIAGVEPVVSDKVKILQRGPKLFEHLALLDKTILDAQGERIGIMNFDIVLTMPTGPKPEPIPLPTQNFDKVEVPEEVLFDLNSAVIKLNRDEVISLMRGVSLRDIFSARKALKDSAKEEVAETPKKSLEELERGIADLFA